MRPQRVIRVTAAALLAVGLSAAACAPSEEEVAEAFEGIGGVQRVEVDCGKSCTTYVDLTPDVTGQQAADALDAALSLESSHTQLVIAEGKDQSERLASDRAVRLEVSYADDVAHGAELGAAMVRLWALEELPGARFDISDEGAEVGVASSDPALFWDATPSAWEAVSDVPDITLTASLDHLGPRTEVSVRGTWPEDAFAVAHDLVGPDGTYPSRGLTGVLVESDRLAVGSPDVAGVRKVRTYVGGLPEGASLPRLDVYATRDLMALELAAQDGEVPDLTSVLTDLEARDDVATALQAPGAVEVSLQDPAQAREVFESVRDDLEPTQTNIDLRLSATVTNDRGTSLFLQPTADPSLVALLQAAESAFGNPRKLVVVSDERSAPAGASIRLVTRDAELAAEVERLAGAVGTWAAQDPAVDDLEVTVEVLNDGGKQVANWAVEVTADEPRVSEVRYSDLSDEDLRDAWEAGLN